MTKRKLNSLLKKWVPRLDLAGWKITIEYIEYEDNTFGYCHYDIPAKTARIEIVRLNAPEWNKIENCRKPEEILLHELWHVVLVRFRIFENQPNDEIEEDVVDYLTNFSIALDRGI